MALIHGLGDYCIDRYEAAIEGEGDAASAVPAEGRLPEAAISFFGAEAACQNAGFRLCTGDEWEFACRGREGRLYPYVGDYEMTRCNGAEVNTDLSRQTLAPGGRFEGCATPEGVFDLSGNIGEWVATADVTGTLRGLRGGAYANMGKYVRCTWDPPTFQPPSQVFRGQGLRCCVDAHSP